MDKQIKEKVLYFKMGYNGYSTETPIAKNIDEGVLIKIACLEYRKKFPEFVGYPFWDENETRLPPSFIIY